MIIGYKYEITKGEQENILTEDIHKDGQFEIHIPGLIIKSSGKTYRVTELPTKYIGNDYYTVNLEQISE